MKPKLDFIQFETFMPSGFISTQHKSEKAWASSLIVKNIQKYLFVQSIQMNSNRVRNHEKLKLSLFAPWNQRIYWSFSNSTMARQLHRPKQDCSKQISMGVLLKYCCRKEPLIFNDVSKAVSEKNVVFELFWVSSMGACWVFLNNFLKFNFDLQ